MTNASRQQKARDRKRAVGLVPVQVWVPAEHKQAIREYADRLASGLPHSEEAKPNLDPGDPLI